MSRRFLFLPVVFLLAVFFLPGCLGGDAGPATLVTGGTIVTMNPAQPRVEAMVLRAGRIVALGTLADLEAAFPDAARHDLDGHTVLPGFIDSHVHVHELGHDRRKADLTGTETVAAMVERLRAFYPDPEPGQWLVGAGWDEGVWGTLGYPDRAALDEAFPDNPVALESLHGFGGFYNGAALALAGLDATTPDPETGTILRRADGSPTGVMLTLAQGLVNRHIPSETPEETQASIRAGLDAMAAAGVTTIHEAGMGPARLAAFAALAKTKRLPIRVYGMLDGNDAELMDDWFDRGPQIDPAGFFDVRSIKVFYDGSLGSRTALLNAPYADAPESANPTERIAPEAVRALAERAAEEGFQMAVHAIGDEGNNRTLTIYEAVLADYPELDHRWRIEHAQVVLPDFYPRAAARGVIASMQPSHAVGDSRWAEDRLGPKRIRHAYAWRRMLSAGVPLLLNSDLPGEPWTPAQTLYFAVNRQSLDGEPRGGWYADQALSAEEALHGMTVAGAHAGFREGTLGVLTEGAFADFVELDRNPIGIPPADLQALRVMRTWVNGGIVFEAEPTAPVLPADPPAAP